MYVYFVGTLLMAFPESDLTEADVALAGWLKDAKWRKQSDGRLGYVYLYPKYILRESLCILHKGII